MKRIIVLFAFTCLAVAVIAGSGQIIENSIVKVKAVRITPCSAEDTVICTGKVESLADSEVYMPSSGYVNKVYVKTGDKVTLGQRLVDITVANPLQQNITNQYQAYSAYLTQNTNQFSQTSSAPSAVINRTLTAPINGTIESLAATSAGIYLGTDKPAVVIRNDNGIQVRLSVGESQISDLKVGQKAQITGSGFKNSVYSGMISDISSEAKQLISTTGQETVVEAVITVSNPGPDIKPGLTAKAKVITSQSSHVLVVPYEAVMEDNDENEYVYRIVGNKAVKTFVTTGRELENGFEIKKGIQEKDIIILNSDNVGDGMRVVPTIGKAAESNG